jgi:peptidyl-dipeptidase Dcp
LKEVLNKFALHYKTNEPIPMALVERIDEASTFNEGFSTVETIASSLIDMKLHLAGTLIDPTAFERETLNKLNMPEEIVMRHRIPQFGHIFQAMDMLQVITAIYGLMSARMREAFTEGDGPYDKEVAKRLYESVFSVGILQIKKMLTEF